MDRTASTLKTIKHILEDGARFLESKGNANARKEAESLIAFGLAIKRVDIYLQFDKIMGETELSKLRDLFKLRASGMPVQYIVGKVDFRYLTLEIDENVLIPRPETEMIVDVIVNLTPKKAKILELGTGSGAIALSLAKEHEADVDAVDVSVDALNVARKNADRNGLNQINFFESEWFSNINNKYDVVVSNPPYVSKDEYDALPTEVKDFEPSLALTDDGDGLQCIQKIASQAMRHLKQDGSLVLEIGYEQLEKVQRLLKTHGFKKITSEKDLAGHDRFIIAS